MTPAWETPVVVVAGLWICGQLASFASCPHIHSPMGGRARPLHQGRRRLGDRRQEGVHVFYHPRRGAGQGPEPLQAVVDVQA